MRKRIFAIVTIILLALGILSTIYLFKPSQAASLDMQVDCGGTVNKKPGEFFYVKITFKNKGATEGTWHIAITFEGDVWTWRGEEKMLTLRPGEKETLKWEGEVLRDAPIDSIARLVVYYDNEFIVLNWWIHVVSGAELSIVASEVS